MSRAGAIGIGQRLAAEALGTALLVAVVIGSGIMAERLAAGNAAVALLGNTLATGAALVVLITSSAPISGAHFNPAVTMYLTLRRQFDASLLIPYVAAQIVGGLAGAVLAHRMFDLPLVQISSHARTGTASGWASSSQPSRCWPPSSAAGERQRQRPGWSD